MWVNGGGKLRQSHQPPTHVGKSLSLWSMKISISTSNPLQKSFLSLRLVILYKF